MGLLERIFFRDWPRPLDDSGPPDLTLDLARGALGAIRLNDSVETLKERFGPPVSWNRWRKYGEWHYPQLGVWFESFEGVIEGSYLIPRDGEQWSLYPGWADLWEPWAGSICFPSGAKISALEVRPDDFVEHLGKPSQRQVDAEAIELTYEHSPKLDQVDVDAEFSPRGELRSLYLYSTRE